MNGDGMRVRQGFRELGAAVLTGGCWRGPSCSRPPAAQARQSGSSAPGVTSNSITVGTISTQTGTLASNFSSLIYGEKAYYDYINAQGGVNGRKIDYKYALDDGGNPTTFNQLANTLINQDHVFAVTGVATAFFSPNLFVESGIPTYGYNVTGNWAGPANLFAAGGSVQYYPAGAPQFAYVARRTTKSPSIAVHRLRGRGVGRRLSGQSDGIAGGRLHRRATPTSRSTTRAPPWPPTSSA